MAFTQWVMVAVGYSHHMMGVPFCGQYSWYKKPGEHILIGTPRTKHWLIQHSKMNKFLFEILIYLTKYGIRGGPTAGMNVISKMIDATTQKQHASHSILQWRHNGCDNVSNHQPHDCLLNRLFRRGSKKTSKLRVTGLYVGNSPVTGEFPAQMARKYFHHDMLRVVTYRGLKKLADILQPTLANAYCWFYILKSVNKLQHISVVTSPDD